MGKLKYVLIKEYLQELALLPESKQKMPTVAEIRRNFGVSLAPVARALQELEHEGVISRRQGSGIVATGATAVVNSSVSDKNNTGSIVLAYTDYPTERMWELTHSFEQYANSNKINLISYKVNQNTPLSDVINFCSEQKNLRGLLLHLGATQHSLADLKQAAKLKLPVVFVDCMQISSKLPENIYCLSPDPESAGHLLAQELLDNGHTRIGYVRNEPQCDYNIMKLKAIMSTLKKGGVEFSNSNVFTTAIKAGGSSLDAAQKAIDENIDQIRKQQLTALIFTSSPGAFAAVNPLKKGGFRVPEDISIIGEGEYHNMRYMTPPLTVATCDYVAMACTAIDIVIENITPKSQTLFFKHKLIRRGSVIKYLT